jgi:hypothetical protein
MPTIDLANLPDVTDVAGTERVLLNVGETAKDVSIDQIAAWSKRSDPADTAYFVYLGTGQSNRNGVNSDFSRTLDGVSHRVLYWTGGTNAAVVNPPALMISQGIGSNVPNPVQSSVAAAARGTISLSSNPIAGDTLVVNGTTFTFVASGATGNQVNIGANAAATATNLHTVLTASVVANVALANYTVSGAVVTVVYKTTGPDGNSFSLYSSAIAVDLSGSSLTGGALTVAGSAVNQGQSCALRLAEILPSNTRVVIINTAVSGTGLVGSRWQPTPTRPAAGVMVGDLYWNAIDTANACLAALPNARLGLIDILQGETDLVSLERPTVADILPADYQTAFDALIDGLRANITGAENCPFIAASMQPEFVASMGAAGVDYNNIHAGVGTRKPYAGFVQGPTGQVNDRFHYRGAGLRVIGDAVGRLLPTVQARTVPVASIPSEPLGVSAQATLVGQITVAWSLPPIGIPTSYQVEYKLTSGSTWTAATVSGGAAARSVIISASTANLSYDFRVRALNDTGTGNWRTLTGVTINLSAPGVVTLATPVMTDTTAALSWTAGTGSPAASYTVRWKPSAGSTWLTASVTAPTVTYTVTGLTQETAYDFEVIATNTAGSSAAATATATTARTAVVPGQPTALTVEVGSTQAKLAWTAPSTGDPETDYSVEYKTSASPTWLVFADGVSTATTAIVTGLSATTAYDFRVKAVNAVGAGTASSVVTKTTLANGFIETVGAPASYAFSMRKAASNSFEPAMTLVRDSDSETLVPSRLDNGDIDTASILTWAGSANVDLADAGWNDLTANDKDAIVPAAAAARRPRLVTAGVLNTTTGGKPKLKFRGDGSVGTLKSFLNLPASSWPANLDWTMQITFEVSTVTYQAIVGSQTANGFAVMTQSGNLIIKIASLNQQFTGAAAVGSLMVLTVAYTESNKSVSVYKNGALLGTYTAGGATNFASLSIGAFSNGVFTTDASLLEVVLWPTLLSDTVIIAAQESTKTAFGIA